MAGTLTPFVFWAQTENQVTLKVELADVKDINVNLEDKRIQVSLHGQGARECSKYGFGIDFHSFINVEGSSYKANDRQVDFTLKKESRGWWPRLTSQPQKPSWLKIDFDKWKSEDMKDNEDNEKRDIRTDYPDMFDKVHKEEFGYRKENFKKVYLIIYNLCQFVGFTYILLVMGIRYYKDGPASMKDTYAFVGNPIKFVQLLQFLEVMHPLFGYTKGNALVPFLQISGRAFILFCMIESETRMQTKPVVFYLFLVWSTIEIVRYPYYITQLLHIEVYLLKWLRYTLWVPLYPLGIACESITILRNIPYFEETQRFTISLPNALNFSLHFPSFMRVYLLLLCIPVLYTLMSHMNNIRHKKLGSSNIKRKYT